MKKIFLILLVSLFVSNCSNEQVGFEADASTANNIALTAKSTASTSSWGDYNIAVSVSSDGSEWTYTITRSKASAKNLGHFIIDLNNCGDDSASFGDIIGATVNDNQADISHTEGSGTTCNPQATTANFVKFANVPESTIGWVLVLKFDRGYETFATGAAWIKAGTSCNQGVVLAPGCPKEERCSFSQGYFFANGAGNNGATNLWINGLNIGGVNYNQQQGNQAWMIDRGPGGDTTMNAFFQLGAVRLSTVESQVAADVTIVDAYFTGIDLFNGVILITSSNGPKTYQYFNLPAISGGYTKAEVAAAGTRIGTFIDANHCD